MTELEQQEYIAELMSTPWAKDGLHCWSLTRQAVRDMFGYELPPVIEIAPEGRRSKIELFRNHPELLLWEVVEDPRGHWAVALMKRKAAQEGDYEHSGVYLPFDGGCVLHTEFPQGVAFERLREIELYRAWSKPTFLRLKAI